LPAAGRGTGAGQPSCGRGRSISCCRGNEAIAAHCTRSDIAIMTGDWWTSFTGPDGAIDRCDAPLPSCKEALWAARAAAGFGMFCVAATNQWRAFSWRRRQSHNSYSDSRTARAPLCRCGKMFYHSKMRRLPPFTPALAGPTLLHVRAATMAGHAWICVRSAA
jgi:hypothetical protein